MRYVKDKSKVIKFLAIFIVLVPGLFYYSFYKAVKFVEDRDTRNFNDGIEVGRFIQLNEDAENTQLEIKQKKEASKEAILKKLASIESYNGKVRKLLDTNNKYSLGLYHFQAGTVKDMYKRYYGRNISIEQAVQIAEDDDKSTKLAYDAIFVKKELYHWHNSMIKMNKLGMIAYGN